MEEEQIKSAFEIAMERIASLPELTPEEIAAQKEREFRPIGTALSHRYLKGEVSEDELHAELGQYQGEKGETVRRAAISSLCQAIQLVDISKADRALTALLSLAASGVEGFGERIRDEYREAREAFEQEKHLEYLKYDALLRKELESEGIRGSAVMPNLVENEKWMQNLARVLLAHESKLEKIRENLATKIRPQ